MHTSARRKVGGSVNIKAQTSKLRSEKEQATGQQPPASLEATPRWVGPENLAPEDQPGPAGNVTTRRIWPGNQIHSLKMNHRGGRDLKSTFWVHDFGFLQKDWLPFMLDVID